MPKRRRRHPNWPYRFAWLAIIGSVLVYLALGTLVGGMTIGHRNRGNDWWIAFVASLLDVTVASWYFAVGASIGSFLNVVAYRLPLGRTLGGHSGCPYCCSTINSFDNVPVLGWLKLRGRCRTCHLPISPQYPLVELLVGLAFLLIFFTELGRGEANLPGRIGGGGGLFRLTITGTIMMRQISYLSVVCGLIAAGLIALKRQFVPLKLFAWSVLPLVVCGMIDPRVILVPWRIAGRVGPLESRFDAIVTLVCGMVTAVAVARLVAPVFYPGMDRGLIRSDAKTSAARAWIGGLAIAGALCGWQAVVPLAWCVVSVWCVGSLVCIFIFYRYAVTLWCTNPLIWLWLGLIVFRASWHEIDTLQLLPVSWPVVVRHVVGAVLLVPVGAILNSLFAPSISETDAQKSEHGADDEEDEESEEVDGDLIEGDGQEPDIPPPR
jgi:leader peptidase (prepilin peptidase) / N-methyltransferase